MSARNKLQNKADRRYDREHTAAFDTRPLSSLDRSACVDVLCDPKEKLGGRGRRYLQRALSKTLVMPSAVIRPPAVKLAEKLASLTLKQVIHRRSQFAARAAGAKYKLTKLSENSIFRDPLQRLQDVNIHAMKQAQAELDARRLHATKKLAQS